MVKDTQPLAEVFGFSPEDFSDQAERYRERRLCPFNNIVPNCTKDKAKNPLGVCSINYGGTPVITCPIRFREDWLITDDAADFFFSTGATWTSLTEVRLHDYYGKSAGNIDVVMVAYDEKGQIYDFGSLEIQAVYISGNIRDPFAHYMTDYRSHAKLDWSSHPNFPRPDFLSSSRKRLAPQLLFKGGILHRWKKKMAVALDSSFFNTLPDFKEVEKEEAEIAWLVYDLNKTENSQRYSLKKTTVVYTKFSDSMNAITRPKAGNLSQFMGLLQSKVDEKLESAPINKTIELPPGK